MTDPVTLYTMIHRDRREGGDEVVLYEHCTANVISQYWPAYTSPHWEVIIREYHPTDEV